VVTSRRLGADRRPNRPGDQEAEQREDDRKFNDGGYIPNVPPQPFIMLTSSTAIEPRLRKIDDENGKPDGRLGRRDGQHEQREDLADHVAEFGREGDEVDVDRQQDQLDRHQDDDDVLAVQEDAEHRRA
jgi:hypothetical protein